jgi:hypothetical protein
MYVDNFICRSFAVVCDQAGAVTASRPHILQAATTAAGSVVDRAVIVYALHLAPLSTKRQTMHLHAASAGTGSACQAGAHRKPTSHTNVESASGIVCK